MLKLGRISVVLAVFFGLMLAAARPADDDKQLGRLKGVVGFATAPDAPLHEVFGPELIPDDTAPSRRAIRPPSWRCPIRRSWRSARTRA
jgi:hypothetical protein